MEQKNKHKTQSVRKLNKTCVQALFSFRSRITVQVLGCCQRMHFVGTWRWWQCCSLCASRIKGRHCWNEKQMLVRNSPDCSSFFLFSCLSFQHCLSPSPPLSLLCISTLYSLLFLSFLTLTHTVPEAILKSAWWQSPQVGLLLRLQAEFFHHPTTGLRDSPPLWCQWRRERMRKREV